MRIDACLLALLFLIPTVVIEVVGKSASRLVVATTLSSMEDVFFLAVQKAYQRQWQPSIVVISIHQTVFLPGHSYANVLPRQGNRLYASTPHIS